MIEFKEYIKKDSSISFCLFNSNYEQVGDAYGSISDFGHLTCAIKIYNDENQQNGVGFRAFKEIFDYLNSKSQVKIIHASWHQDQEFIDYEQGMSTNLRLFLECYEKGGTPKDCARLTPTGKWAAKLGYTAVNVVSFNNRETHVEFSAP